MIDHKAYTASAIVGFSLLGVLIRAIRRSSRQPALPPGPPSDWLIGHARVFPKERWYETFSAWQTIYGDAIYLNVFGSVMIVINSLEMSRELMEKRGNIHSGRVERGMLIDVMDWGWSIVTAPPGPFHSEARTIFRKSIGAQEVAQYDAIFQEELENMLTAVKGFQGDPTVLIQGIIGATVIRVAYGDSVNREHGADLVQLNRETIELASDITSQFWPVNFVPQLHYLPDWLPLPFKRVGKVSQKLLNRLRFWPWEQTVKHFEAGIAGPSIAYGYLEKNEKLEAVRDTLGMMYGAGVDNTAATLLTFIATMLAHPNIQKKIQEELDTELGPIALPSFQDRVKLPYTDAAWRESNRLNPTTPLGVPHRAMEDDVYNGMFIPKDAMLMTNIGFMCRDPRIWDNPNEFQPERWLPSHNPKASTLPDVNSIIFGFGRRICPGQYLAERTGFVLAAGLLKAYNIVPIPGQEPSKRPAFKDTLIRFPEGLRCRFQLRSKA